LRGIQKRQLSLIWLKNLPFRSFFLKKTKIKNKNMKFNMSMFFGLRTSGKPRG
jgi:hypothetical protein